MTTCRFLPCPQLRSTRHCTASSCKTNPCLRALDAIDGETALTLTEMTEAGLVGTAGQQKWRELMRKQLITYKSEFRRRGIEEGRAEDILRILDKRGIAVDDTSREQIVSCDDLDTLGTWLDRSLTATQVSDLFA